MLSELRMRILSLAMAAALALTGVALAEEVAAPDVEAQPEEIEFELAVPEEEAVPAEEAVPQEEAIEPSETIQDGALDQASLDALAGAGTVEASAQYCAHRFENGRCAVCGAMAKPVLPEYIIMGVGEKGSAQPAFDYPAGACAVNYVSSKPKVVAVDGNGQLTAKKKGTARITVTAANGLSAWMDVQVLKKPSSISLKTDEATLGVGETYALQVVLKKGTGGGVSYSSSRPDVARVDASGKVIAVAVGEAKITAELYTGKKAVFTAKVKNAPTSADMKLTPDSTAVGVGEIINIPVVYANGCGGTVNYSVNGSSVLLDPETQRLKGASAGSAVVTATAYNGAQSSVTIEVKAAPTKVVVENAPTYLAVGDKWQLGVLLYAGSDLCDGGYTFKSSKSSVLTVDENGMLNAVKSGSAKITVTTYNGKKTTFKVKVLKLPTSIALSAEKLTLKVGKSAALKVSLTKKSYAEVRFFSDNEKIATVSADGVVTGVDNGIALITAVTSNGLRAQCSVTVGDGVETPTTVDTKAWKSQVVALDWYKGGSEVLKKDAYGYIYDIKTGIVVKIKRMGGHDHADVEPATKEDTKKLLAIAGGEFDWASHGVILYANGKYVACAINTMPHGQQTLKDNNYDGQFCLHMVNSKTHGTGKINVNHQAAIKAAYNWAH